MRESCEQVNCAPFVSKPIKSPEARERMTRTRTCIYLMRSKSQSGINLFQTLPRLRSPAHGNPGRGCNSPTDHAPDVLHDGRGDVRGSGSDVIPEPGLCAGCGDRISDRYYLQAVEKPWHARCLRCAQCHLPLDSEQTCYARDGSIFCKEDYYR